MIEGSRERNESWKKEMNEAKEKKYERKTT